MDRITNENLKNIKSVTLGLENCDSYTFNVRDILAINFENIIERCREDDGECYYNTIADDGQITISKDAFEVLGEFATEEFADGTTWLDSEPAENFYFYNRINQYCDVCFISIEFKDGTELQFDVPYEPLEENIHGTEVELSNCPSCELTENGDLLILFGNSSKSYKRIDNNYQDLIFDLEYSIEKPINEILEIELNSMNNSIGCYFDNLILDCKLINKNFKGVNLNLKFLDVTNIIFSTYFEDKMDSHQLVMSKMKDGRIFVQIGCFLNFECAGIINLGRTYVPNKKEEGEIDKILMCEVTEKRIQKTAFSSNFVEDKGLDINVIKNAFDKVIKNEISIVYFRCWLDFYTEILYYYNGRKENNFKIVAQELYRLYLNIFYEPDTNNCMDKIKATLDKIIELCK
ncbi:MAG: hypothetical protein IJZ29_03010 [Clostridia bacterium]|nr:hypothetical protein [Clostridia bacterium]